MTKRLLNIIKEIAEAAKESPKQLYTKLIQERLQAAIKSYYADLDSKFQSYENKAEINSLSVMKKLVK